MRSRLAPGGAVVVNVGHPEGSHALEQALAATMRRSFATVLRDPSEPTNTVLVGTNARLTKASAQRAGEQLPAPLRPVSLRTAGRLEDGLRGGPVWTDDRAPVEWLIDASIVDVAANGER